MKIEFIGVGEAFDESLPNNSQILQWDETHLLIDCGYSVPQAFWKRHSDPDYLDGIYLSHRHADHYFGLPSLLVRFAEDQRSKPLVILCPEGMKGVVTEMIDYGYAGILAKLEFKIEFREVSVSETHVWRNASLAFAVSSHSVKNFAIAVTVGDTKYAYSGDGNFNSRTTKLYSNCSLLVHESYALGPEEHGHAEIRQVIAMAEQQKVKCLALTHIQREIRKNRMEELQDLVRHAAIDVIIPEPGDVLEI